MSYSADVYLKASGSPAHLFNFDNISQALEQGSAITFSAIAFLCAGGRESTFSGIGGHITSKYICIIPVLIMITRCPLHML